jgi:3' terminal RNA ribose 2'-O-methyltransferase Hen1
VLLTISTTHRPATDLGYLLHKNPSRVHSSDLSFGTAYAFYPEASADRCTVALLLEVDPVELSRGRGMRGGLPLQPYVNDRPYAASSFLSVAFADLYRSAIGGRSRERPELAETAIPLEVRIAALPCRGGESMLRRLFEPLAYAVAAKSHPLDDRFEAWGDSAYLTVHLQATVRLKDLLTHLYVLVPVLDDDKHYWVTEDEIEKLLLRGEGWLGSHPERDLITHRYLRRQRSLTRLALARLADEDDPDPDAAEERHGNEEEVVEQRISLNEQRLGSVIASLKASGARRVLDLGCGEGRLLRALLDDHQFTEIVGVDVSHRALEVAGDRLHLDRLPMRQAERIRLLQGSLVYRDERLAGYDAAAVIEVIEHLDPWRLAAFERAVFDFARPRTVIATTPNVEYNARFPDLPTGRLRHRDHRFEWTRDEFRGWAEAQAERFGYTVRFVPVGPEDPEVGPPTQMAVWERQAEEAAA